MEDFKWAVGMGRGRGLLFDSATRVYSFQNIGVDSEYKSEDYPMKNKSIAGREQSVTCQAKDDFEEECCLNNALGFLYKVFRCSEIEFETVLPNYNCCSKKQHCILTIGKLKGFGFSCHSKKAKAMAARDIVKSLAGLETSYRRDKDTHRCCLANGGQLCSPCLGCYSLNEDQIEKNPISLLNEYCSKFKHSLEYIYEENDTENFFVAYVRLGSIEKTGVGRNKKEAKRMAAKEMWMFIVSNNLG